MFTIPAAMIVDALLGEPARLWRALPHPAVLFGRLVALLDRLLNRGGLRRAKGALALCLLLGAAWAAAEILLLAPFSPVVEIVAGAILLAQRSLADHARAVAHALDRSLPEGREAVSHIVGRDVQALDRAGVARAAIESAAENFSDGVVAPVFWFALLGLPGLAAYKALNTADSMIGYLNDRYRDFGWAAARADDLANLAPARLSALLLSLGDFNPGHMRVARRDAGLHRSPNAGWPEAAMASITQVSLSGPRAYDGRESDDPFVLPEGRRDPGAADILRAVRALWRGWAALLVATILLAAAQMPL